MPHLVGSLNPDETWASTYDWDPRWCKDPEVLATPCRRGHVDRGVTTTGHLYCRTCEPRRGSEYKPKVQAPVSYLCATHGVEKERVADGRRFCKPCMSERGR